MARFWHGSPDGNPRSSAVYTDERHHSMKKLLVLTFAISSLLRPSLVLCMESTGDVRVEYQETYCCVSQTPASATAIDASVPSDCDGCLDVSLPTHSLMLKRVSSAPATFVFVLPLIASASQHSTVLAVRTPTDSHSALRSLATTVIRR